MSPCLFLKQKMTFSVKLDQNYDCVFKIMSSTKITSSEFLKNKCYFHFPIDVCTHVVMCGSDENYFGQCFPIKFSNVATLHFTCVFHNYQTK